MKLKISGCINACGHHHVGHIGILGLEKAGVESYQITLGGDATTEAEIGTRAGPGFGADEILPAIERLLLGYLKLRLDRHESFLEAYRRLGLVPFKAFYTRKQERQHDVNGNFETHDRPRHALMENDDPSIGHAASLCRPPTARQIKKTESGIYLSSNP